MQSTIKNRWVLVNNIMRLGKRYHLVYHDMQNDIDVTPPRADWLLTGNLAHHMLGSIVSIFNLQS